MVFVNNPIIFTLRFTDETTKSSALRPIFVNGTVCTEQLTKNGIIRVLCNYYISTGVITFENAHVLIGI